MHQYWSQFVTLLATPFEHIALIWGIVPLYFGWIFNELTSSKANFRTAIQTGFSFLWAAAQWLYPLFHKQSPHDTRFDLSAVLPVNLAVTGLVLVLGILALWSGLRKRFPRYGKFLGHTRFANYFMIMIFPIQAHRLLWSWISLETIVIFAIPVWLVLYFALMPVRK
jgi:hypothetical protein